MNQQVVGEFVRLKVCVQYKEMGNVIGRLVRVRSRHHEIVPPMCLIRAELAQEGLVDRGF